MPLPSLISQFGHATWNMILLIKICGRQALAHGLLVDDP